MPENPYEPPQEVNAADWSPGKARWKAALWAVAVIAIWGSSYFAVAIQSFSQSGTNR